MARKENEATRMRHLFRQPTSDVLKRFLARKIAEQRKIIEGSENMNEILKAQGRLEAYRDVLYAGRKARRFLDKILN